MEAHEDEKMKIRSNDPQKTSRSTRAQAAVRSYSGANPDSVEAKRRKGDKVTVSATASKLAAAVEEASKDVNIHTASTERLETLKAQIESGEYQVDPKELAVAILNNEKS